MIFISTTPCYVCVSVIASLHSRFKLQFFADARWYTDMDSYCHLFSHDSTITQIPILVNTKNLRQRTICGTLPRLTCYWRLFSILGLAPLISRAGEHSYVPATASLSLLLALKAGTFRAGIIIRSPVKRLRPSLAGRIFTPNVPKPGRMTFSPLFKASVTDSKSADSAARVCLSVSGTLWSFAFFTMVLINSALYIGYLPFGLLWLCFLPAHSADTAF